MAPHPIDETSLRMLCWEGYDADAILQNFKAAAGLDLQTQTLLSDAAAADRLLDGEYRDWDIININNAYVRDCLEPAGLIQPLDDDLHATYLDSIHPLYEQLLPWSYNAAGELIGIGQRFGPFNLVINLDLISRETAEDEGFRLADEPSNHGRYAILDYPDFNLFHVAIGAGLNPFTKMSKDDLANFETTAERWYRNAAFVDDDHHCLNRALLDGDISFYLSGGIYTASPARLAGYTNIFAVTPERGPIDGKGGIVFSEITSLVRREKSNPLADKFLHFMLQPETAAQIAFIEGTCNPVAQIGDPRVFEAFSKKQLQTIQWDSLERDLRHCAHYQIPPDRPALLRILKTIKSRHQHQGEIN